MFEKHFQYKFNFIKYNFHWYNINDQYFKNIARFLAGKLIWNIISDLKRRCNYIPVK